ncbi:MAG TPA: multiheme c-type cytochrome [Dissulfurispiraceae bacterium]|nr:multiheme c-type cytochrome [Dissulfurispiraceae bacterium]
MKHWNKFSLLLILLLVALPLLANAGPKKQKQHPAVSEEQECLDCHAQQYDAWQGSKHGQMGVQCVVCHGSLDATFFVKPPLERCNGCHADQVAEMQKKSAKLTCTSCHDKHTLAATSKTPFHKKGGN